METHDLVILGGGLSGLTAGMIARAPVFEAEPEYGGAAASDRVGEFTFDRGIHVLQTQNQYVLDLLTSLGINFAIRERSAHIFAFDRYTAYPFQVNSTSLPLLRRLRCILDYIARERNPDPKNYLEWMYRTIGRGFTDTFLGPYSEKFWRTSPHGMTFDWTGNRVPKTNIWLVLRGAVISLNTKVGTNAIFRYPDGESGYGTVADAIANQVPSLNVSHRAIHVDTKARRIHFQNGRVVQYRVLLSTIPLPEFARIATDVPREASEAASNLRTNSIIVVNLGIARPGLTDKHWVHFPEDKFSFFRISFPHNFSSALVPAGMSSVSAEISYDPANPPEENALIERVISDLCTARILERDDKIVVRATRKIRYGYCIYDFARQEALSVIRRWLQSIDVVPGGRYGLWTYFWSDEAILSGRKSAQQAQKHLARLKDEELKRRP